MWKSLIKKIAPILILGLMCLVIYNSAHKARVYKDKAESLELTISDLDQEVKKTRVMLNDSVSVYQAEVKNLKMTENNIRSKYHQLLVAMNTKPKDVNSVTEVSSVIHGVDTVIAFVDSFGGLKARLEDPYINIGVNVFPDRNTIIDYKVRDSITVINIQKKHSWLFGLIKWKEHKGTKVINHNPKAEIVNLQTIDVIE